MADVGAVWHLRYRAASASAYKWEAVGASPVSNIVATAEFTTGGSYGAATAPVTAGPLLTVPLKGDFIVSLGANIQPNAANGFGLMSYKIGAAAATDADAISLRTGSGGANDSGYVYRDKLQTFTAATTDLLAQYRYGGSASRADFDSRFISITPIRVG